jgi:putative ABC transport system permease protein
MATPPKILLWILNQCCSPSRQDLKGDFLELYEYRASEWGRSRANLRFLWDTVTVLPLRFLIKKRLPSQSSIVMFSHYAKIAFRTLSRSKAYSLINVLGLAVGMGVCLLIYQYISFELSYDRSYAGYQNIYRLTQTTFERGEQVWRDVFVEQALGPTAIQTIPEVQEMVRVHPQDVGLIMINDSTNERHQEDDILYVDHGFLQMFDFSLLYGNRDNALSEPYNMVITRRIANKYFGSTDPIGKMLIVSGGGALSGNYTITGVLNDIPVNSHLQFDFLLPIEVKMDNYTQYKEDNGWEWAMFATYIKVHEQTDMESLRGKFDQMIATYAAEELKSLDQVWKTGFQPVADIHLKSDYVRDNATNNGELRNVQFFAIVAAFILVMAWVNYINLSTARAMQRAKEVGIRKSIGAYKNQLIAQFLTESLLLNTIAGILSLVIAVLLMPVLSQLVDKQLSFDLLQTPEFWIWSLGVLIIGSCISGLYPAFLLSSFKPSYVLKSNQSVQIGGFGLRKGLITFQFFASVMLIAATWLVYRQIVFMKNVDNGVDMEKIVIVNGPREILKTIKEEGTTLQSKYQLFKSLVNGRHSVEGATAIGSIPGRGYQYSVGIQLIGDEESNEHLGNMVFTDSDFADIYNVEFLAGGGFSADMKPYKAAIVNEEAVKVFGLGSAQEALGKRFDLGDTTRIVGVIKDINWSSLRDPHVPILFVLDNEFGVFLSIKINLSNIPETLQHIEASYHTSFPNDPFEYFFLDDSFNRQYQADQQFGSLFTAFSVLAIFISCLGLFALVSFSASLKTKEIGIRKVLGASVSQLMALLSKEYLVLLLIASLLATPLVIWGGQQWLENYAFRIEMGVEFIVVPVVVLLIISLLTVSYKTWAAARANPVKSLRTE